MPQSVWSIPAKSNSLDPDQAQHSRQHLTNMSIVSFVDKGKQCRPRSDSKKTWRLTMVPFITVSNRFDADHARRFYSTCLQRLPAVVTSRQRIPTADDTNRLN